ncbi:MAG TPA: hypothetical protein VLF40_00900 [Candidatus Saccharimonadales bacterium]|nr:hypothetical protein [Candidatus Saccharimonadales bacterium]
MSERCPLTTLVFDDDIPEACREHCEPFWRDAMHAQEPEVDEFEEYEETECEHPESEFSADSLQPGEGAARFYSINHECTTCRMELDSETFTFTCPHA